MMDADKINTWEPTIAACITIIVTILIFIITVRRENEKRLADNFNKIYFLTFGLRKHLQDCYKDCLPNGKFFYETDIIWSHEDIKNAILDYLTEIESLLFSIVRKGFIHSSFEKMMSKALYERLSSLYGFIIKMRTTNSKKSFANFEKTLHKIERMKKITTKKENRCYVGIRCSDIAASKHYFDNSITLFSNCTADLYSVRPNQNLFPKEFPPYLQREMRKILKKSKNTKFIFYNSTLSYRLPSDMQASVFCRNAQSILTLLNDKITCKTLLLNHKIPVIPFESVTGDQILQKFRYGSFDASKAYILQDTHGGGGIGTFLFNNHTHEEVGKQLIPLKTYIISEYLPRSISINTHIFLSDKQTVLSPASIQIVEITNNQLCYRGADYCAARDLPSPIKEEIKHLSFLIANLLREHGYRGVAGIDFLIDTDGKVYCTEINPRFQASTVLLDKYLSQKSNKELAHSVYELHEQAFSNNMKTDLCFDDEICLSCYYYYKDRDPIDYYRKKIEIYKQQNVEIALDGLNFEQQKFDDNSYLFRATFAHAICRISPDNELWISDNIKISVKPNNLLQLKIALLNQGVRITKPDKTIKKGVYESVDIVYRGYLSESKNVDINCAYGIHHAEYSPFELDCSTGKLTYFDEVLGDFIIEHDLLQNLSELSRKILYLATDRLRIKMIGGCEYKNHGIGCSFCNVPFSERHYQIVEIINALEEFKKLNVEFGHVLIGGGTCLDATIWQEIANVAHYLQTDDFYKDKPISLMSILPPAEVLPSLREAGITEVAFNLEIANEETAKGLLPGKWRNRQVFYETMQAAVKHFGIKCVRSAFVVGIDKEKDLLGEIKILADRNILPCLSPFRALPNSKMENIIAPSNDYLLHIYCHAKESISDAIGDIKQLGPLCKRCGNNMLIL